MSSRRFDGFPARRRGYTLLEMILALAIGVLLLAALYTAMNMQFQLTRSGRDLAEHSNQVRGLLARIESDVIASLGPPSAQAIAAQQNSGGTNSTTSSSSSSSSSSSKSSSSSTPTNMNVFNLGIQGDSTTLTVFASKVPPEISRTPPGQTPPPYSDLRRITYWLAGGTSSAQGLARRELSVATSDAALAAFTTNGVDEASCVIAPEVIALKLQYFDGNQWQDQWDGTAAGPDGVTPIGPPLSIAFTLTVRRPNAPAATGPQQPQGIVYRHVVPLYLANGTTTVSSSTTTGGSTSP